MCPHPRGMGRASMGRASRGEWTHGWSTTHTTENLLQQERSLDVGQPNWQIPTSRRDGGKKGQEEDSRMLLEMPLPLRPPAPTVWPRSCESLLGMARHTPTRLNPMHPSTAKANVAPAESSWVPGLLSLLSMDITFPVQRQCYVSNKPFSFSSWAQSKDAFPSPFASKCAHATVLGSISRSGPKRFV